jgi:hypothetical protein
MAQAIDQSNYVGSTGIGFGDTLNGRDYMSQAFIAAFDNIAAVSFYINGKDGNTNNGYAVWIDNANSSSFATGTVAVGIGGFTEIPNAALVVGALTKYQLASSVRLIPGQRYCIVFSPWDTSAHAHVASYNDWVSSTALPYSKGIRVHYDGSFLNPTTPDAGNDDILFETYGERADFHPNKMRPRLFAPGNAR